MIFSLFLNNYIIKPIRSLNFFAKQISYDNPKSMNKLRTEFNKRDDEIGNLSNSLSDMTNKLYQRIELAERFAAQLKLNKLPKNSSKIRVRNRCEITGRPHGVYRKLKISRIALREMASDGKIPGVIKSSW